MILFLLFAVAKELTAEQRSLILGPPGSVTTSRSVVRVPLRGTDHRGYYKCPYMSVYVNGHGPYTFLFDTGSSYTMITTKVIESAHVPVWVDRGGYHDLIRVRELRVGGVSIRDIVTVRDDDFDVDGVLGFKSFGDMCITFDLRKRALLVSRKPLPLAGGFDVPYHVDHNVPVIPVTIGTAEVPILIDTGDDAYAFEVRTEDLKGATLAHPAVAASEVRNGAKVASTSVSTLASKLQIGPLSVDDAVVGINDALPVPDFGVDFLENFRFAFDPRRMTVTFQPLGRRPIKISGSVGPGFTLRFDGKGTVSNVVPESTAAQRGMHGGDTILTINGVAATRYTPRSWDRLMEKGKQMTVSWMHDGEKRSADLEISELR